MELRWWRGRPDPDEVEIGGTWLAADVQRTAVNTEAKLLLLTHAFDVWNVDRVALATDERNERSRAAIARLGATFEGILRNHRPSRVPGEDGTGTQHGVVLDHRRRVAGRARGARRPARSRPLTATAI